jgi:hypothetical protein
LVNDVLHKGKIMSAALFTGWAPAFAFSEIDQELAEGIAKKWCSTYDWSLMRVIGLQSFVDFLNSVADSATGPDGLPSSAWKAAGLEGAESLYLLFRWMAEGGNPPPSFNAGLFVFPPKGSSPDDATAVHREVKDTRPITLKNTDNKILAGVQNFALAPVVAEGACSTQRGFIKGRNFMQNLVDLDTEGRILSNEFHSKGDAPFSADEALKI